MKQNRFLFYISIISISFLLVIPVKISGQTNRAGKMPQYLFEEFSNCNVRMKNGQIQNTMMNYNTVSQRMVYVKDGTYLDLMNTDMVDTVFLQNKIFVPFGKTFYELRISQPIAFFIQHKGDLIQAGKPVGYGGTSEVASTDYVSSINLSSGYYNLPIPADFNVKNSFVFWVRKDGKMLDFLNERQFLKLFPDKTDLLKQFIKKNKVKFDKPDQLQQLIQYCSTLN
jgi:hypothetical protein